MFTGLIEEIGIVEALKQEGSGYSLRIKADKILSDMKIGDSISINGACQTVTAFGNGSFSVFVSKVTAGLTTLGSFRSGRLVNLERAMSPVSKFGGHFVLGHVDGTAEIQSLSKDASGLQLKLSAPAELMHYIADKGSVTVDGISLTVVSLDKTGFSLYLIPETMKNTAVPLWRIGSKVNIETDILAKYVDRLLGNETNRSLGKKDETELKRALAEGGFI